MEFWEAVKALQEGKIVRHLSFEKWLSFHKKGYLISMDENGDNKSPCEVPLSHFMEFTSTNWIIKEN